MKYLIFFCFYRAFLRQQIRFIHFGRNESNSDFSDTWVSIKCIESDLILRLTKLDEDKKGYHTIHSAWKCFDKVEKDSKKKKKLRSGMKAFKDEINSLKTKKRNIVLAHLKQGERDDLNVLLNFGSKISKLMEVVDLLNGEKMKYFWKENKVEKDLIKEINFCSNYIKRANEDKTLYEKKIWEEW